MSFYNLQNCTVKLAVYRWNYQRGKNLQHKNYHNDFIILEIISPNTDHNYKDCLFWVGWQSWTCTPPLGRHSAPWSSTTGCGGLCTSLFLAPIHIHTDPCKKGQFEIKNMLELTFLDLCNQISIAILKNWKITWREMYSTIFCVIPKEKGFKGCILIMLNYFVHMSWNLMTSTNQWYGKFKTFMHWYMKLEIDFVFEYEMFP